MSLGSSGEGPNSPTAFDFGLGAPQQQSGPGADPGSSRKQTRRRAAVDTRSLTIPIIVVVLVVLALGGAAFTAWSFVQSSEAQVRAASAPFCADLGKTPGVLDQPGFGWPTDVADLPTTLGEMRAYQSSWKTLAAEAPPTIKADVAAVATAAGTIADGVETSKSIDRPGSLARISSVTSHTVIPAWAQKYCG